MSNKRKVTFEVEFTCEATEAEIREWISFYIGFTSEISLSNPLEQNGDIHSAQISNLDISSVPGS